MNCLFLDLFSLYDSFVYIVEPSQNAAITRTVLSVKNNAVTVATGNHVITWTEPVQTDVTLEFTERNVIKVMQESSSFNKN